MGEFAISRIIHEFIDNPGQAVPHWRHNPPRVPAGKEWSNLRSAVAMPYRFYRQFPSHLFDNSAPVDQMRGFPGTATAAASAFGPVGTANAHFGKFGVAR
ncbi:MAG: hypothetical protein WBF93_21400 [Pirellulales bacterium]